MDNKNNPHYKEYKTNLWASVTFYAAVVIYPLSIVFFMWLMLPGIKILWPVLLFFLLFIIPLEFFALKNLKVRITVDNDGLAIYRGGKIRTAKWDEITALEELLFGAGEATYLIKTKDKKKTLGFSSSISPCDDLLKEIENRTGLKFKQRL